MKIDRVILSTNNNPIYYEFWNPLSKLYLENFGIKPTLIFLGTEKECLESNLSDNFGEIIVQEIVNTQSVEWTATWTLFYFTKMFPDDIILINGIDQIPLGTKFLYDCIKDIDDNKYVMLIDDAYKLTQNQKDWSQGGFSPSSYHIAKGNVFMEIYNFEDTFAEEIKKIESLNLKTMWKNWGLDEAYSSYILYTKRDKINVESLSMFKEILTGGRIECNRNQETQYSLEKLTSNQYIECHSCRPYSKHKDYLDKLFNQIPKFI